MAGVTVSSGIRKEWTPGAYPLDSSAANRLREWLAGASTAFDAVRLDLRGADLRGADFSYSWFTEAKLRGVNLAGVELYRSDLEAADMSAADLTGAGLVRVNLDEAILRSTCLDGADMGKASLYGVDASGAGFRAAKIFGASFLNVNLCGADLSDAMLEENPFQVRVDDSTVLRGLSGSVFGPVEVVRAAGDVRVLEGEELQSWLRERGAQVEVLRPKGEEFGIRR